MNVIEFSNEFDILYDNISSNAAPGLNSYEKSLFLTRAQEEIIKNYYNPFNSDQAGFEGNEDKRRGLSEIVKNYRTQTKIETRNGISPNSQFFEIPENAFYIVHEKGITGINADKCISEKTIEIKPITHDEYNISIKNPYRKPNQRKAWRMDISKQNGNKVVEIISSIPFKEYTCRYIEKPLPIIIENIEDNPEIAGMGLTIEGLNTKQECLLNKEVHREILNRAVEMAIRAYRENSLQSNVELNKNNV